MCERQVERIQASETREVTRSPGRDRLVIEAPLELRLGGQPTIVIMRTPGHDGELARGLLLAEGALDRDPASTPELPTLPTFREPPDLGPDERGNVLDLDLEPGRMAGRALLSSSSCGVCGKRAIADLELRASPVLSGLTVTAGLVAELPERLRAAQAVFDATGGLHAAAAFDPDGTLLVVREDVGRHNAVDKVVGWALGAGLVPLDHAILCVSGRLSFEIVQKAVVAGFPVVVAVSAPSSLAVDLAERFRLTLCGFTRERRFNVYSHPVRVV
jgi:FdhD protein